MVKPGPLNTCGEGCPGCECCTGAPDGKNDQETPCYTEGADSRQMFGDTERVNPYPVHSARFHAWEAGWGDTDQSLEREEQPVRLSKVLIKITACPANKMGASELVVDAVIPSWDPDLMVHITMDSLPLDIRSMVEEWPEKEHRIFGEVDLLAKRVFPKGFEVAPELDDSDEL